MLSDKSRRRWWERRKGNPSIQHKMAVSIFACLLLFCILTLSIYSLLSLWLGTGSIAFAAIIAIILALFLARITARILSFKFVEEVNGITGTAKAIANSRDLSRRIRTSRRPDELNHLEAALNDMLDQLEESFILQKRFTDDASHELRTPIAVLNGYLDILQTFGQSNPDLREEALLAMKEEIHNMQRLSENLLLLSRLELEQHNLEWDIVDLAELLQKLADDTALIAGGRKVECQVKAVVKIKGDYSLLLQMLRAVIENSVKYTDENGKIIVSLWQETEQAVIEISDNGLGIPEGDIDRIFERFYRVDKSRDRSRGGTGLGLSLVKHIAELHGGTVEASSLPDKGTKILFRLPLSYTHKTETTQ